jgi:hypothetical protein
MTETRPCRLNEPAPEAPGPGLVAQASGVFQEPEQRPGTAPTRLTNRGALPLVSGVDRKGSASSRSQIWKQASLAAEIDYENKLLRAASWSGWPDLNRRPLRPELAAPLGVCPLPQLMEGVGGSSCSLLTGDVAVFCCCTSALRVSFVGAARCALPTCRPSASQAGHIPVAADRASVMRSGPGE